MTFARVADSQALWPGEMLAVTVGDHQVLLLNVEGQVRAFEDRCAHKGMPLSCGKLCATELRCVAHDWTYDACTGRGTNPKEAMLRRFAVRVDNDGIWVDLEVPA